MIWTLHDCWPYTGRCAHYDYNQCEKWKNGCGECGHKSQYPNTWIFDRSGEMYQRKVETFLGVENLTIVTPSMWLRDEVGRSFLKGYPIRVIPNGVNSSVFFPRGMGLKSEFGIRRIMLAVAYYWNEQKGWNYLEKIADELQGSEWTLVVIGANRSQRMTMKKRGVMALPKLNDPNTLARWYSAADVFINPTLEDNNPTVNIEAASCGTPVVTFNTGGAAETIHENMGVIVDKHDWKGMLNEAVVIEKACSQRNAGHGIENRFNSILFCREYLEFYRRLVIGRNEN